MNVAGFQSSSDNFLGFSLLFPPLCSTVFKPNLGMRCMTYNSSMSIYKVKGLKLKNVLFRF